MVLLHGKLDIRFLRIPTAYFLRCDPKFLEDCLLPYNTISSQNLTNKWPLSNTKLLCKYGDDFGMCHTFFFITFVVTGNVIEHRHKIVKVSSVSPKSLSRSLILSQSCNVVNPGKIFHSNSAGSPLCSFYQLWSILSFLPKLCWIQDVAGPFQDTTQNPRRQTFARWRLKTVSSPINDSCFHDLVFQWILSTLFISSCSLTNFSEMSNIFFEMRSVEFLIEFWSSRKFFSMNVAAFIVAIINIHQIFECSSPESATFDILFCFFSHLIIYSIHKFCCITSHDEILRICRFLRVDIIRLPWSIMKPPFVPYGLRTSVEKSVSMMWPNLLQPRW